MEEKTSLPTFVLKYFESGNTKLRILSSFGSLEKMGVSYYWI